MLCLFILKYFSWIPPGGIQQLEDRTQPPRQQHAHGNPAHFKCIFSCPSSYWTSKLVYYAICMYVMYCKYVLKLILSLLQLCLQKALKSEFIFAREQIFPVPVNYWKNISRWRLQTRTCQCGRQKYTSTFNMAIASTCPIICLVLVSPMSTSTAIRTLKTGFGPKHMQRILT